jgi:hypothetical protein
VLRQERVRSAWWGLPVVQPRIVAAPNLQGKATKSASGFGGSAVEFVRSEVAAAAAVAPSTAVLESTRLPIVLLLGRLLYDNDCRWSRKLYPKPRGAIRLAIS